MTWSIAILLAIAISAIGDGVIGRTARSCTGRRALGVRHDRRPALRRVLRAHPAASGPAGIVQLALFVAIFTCMILMRFGF